MNSAMGRGREVAGWFEWEHSHGAAEHGSIVPYQIDELETQRRSQNARNMLQVLPFLLFFPFLLFRL